MGEIVSFKKSGKPQAWDEHCHALREFMKAIQPGVDRGCLVSEFTVAWMKKVVDPVWTGAVREAAEITELETFDTYTTKFVLASRFSDYKGNFLSVERRRQPDVAFKPDKRAMLEVLGALKRVHAAAGPSAPMANATLSLLGGPIDVLLKHMDKVSVVGFRDGMTVRLDEGNGNYVKFQIRGFFEKIME